MSACLGETLEQGLFVGIQVQHITMNMLGPDFLKQYRETFKMAGQVAGINRNGDQGLGQFSMDQRAFRQFRQQASRQVVDAIETVVLDEQNGQ